MACRNSEKWLYLLREDFTWDSELAFKGDVAFEDRSGVRRLEILKSGAIRVLEGYAWDGCTPKICVFDINFGTPDGVVDSRTGRPKTYYASLIHDALYQFLDGHDYFTRAQADDCFLRLMRQTGFRPRYIYYWAVRLCGGISRRIARWKRETRHWRIVELIRDDQTVLDD